MPRPFHISRRKTAASNRALRILSSIVRQQSNTHTCPPGESLEGKTALVTGGNRGIGVALSKELARRGATVIIAARGDVNSTQQCAEWAADLGIETSAFSFVSMDLADLASVRSSIKAIAEAACGSAIDLLFANAGLSPNTWSTSAQGHELAFAVNCLGHHALVTGLLKATVLAPNASVIGTTGDIYVLASECTPDFRYRGRGSSPYCRSKLGNMWQFLELSTRFPGLRVCLVHPGVVATELEGSTDGVTGALKRMLMISPELGAQASLIAGTQALPSGSYFHNVHGLMDIPETDPAADNAKRQQFWEVLEDLSGASIVD